MKRFKAFTLIELLVVVAIIALLIAILLPSLAKARAQANKSRCLANVRSIGLSLQTYISDWGKLLPYEPYSSAEWVEVLQAYGNVEKMRQCPSALGGNSSAGASQGSASTPWNDVGTSTIHSGAYGLNAWLLMLRNATPAGTTDTDFYLIRYSVNLNTPGTPAASAANFWHLPFSNLAASIPLACDSVWPEGWPLADNKPPASVQKGGNPASSNSNQMGRFCEDRHLRAVNVSFVDGHAETVTLQNLWTLNWHATWQTQLPLPTIPLN